MKARIKKSDLKSGYDGFEDYLRQEHGLKDGATLERIADGGMYGNRRFVFSSPDGEEIVASGYISSPPVATYSMSLYSERADKLFGED